MQTFISPSPYLFEYTKRDDGLYEGHEERRYWSKRYNRWVRVKARQVRDGATGAKDIRSFAWWVHDQLCADGVWEDGSDVSPWQAALVLHDILEEEGYWVRKWTWLVMTRLMGCKKARLDMDGDGRR